MKLLCDGLDLSEAVLKVIKATAVKSTNPILEGIKLVAKDDRLIIVATDLELVIEKTIRADVISDGEVVVPGKYFSEFVKKLSGEQIELELIDNRQLKISYMDSEGVLQCMDNAQYPIIKKVTEAEHFIILQSDFKDLINKASFSVSQDTSRPILRGVLLEIENHKITAVSLDGYRLSLVNKAVEKQTLNMKIIVPSRSLLEISKFLSDDEKKVVNIYVQKNYMMVDLESTVIITRLLEGEFMNYKQVIPSDCNSYILAKTQTLRDSVERVSIINKTEKNNYIKMEAKEKSLTLTSNSEIGNIKENIPISLKGKDIVIAFNAKYLNECLQAVTDEYIKISFVTPISPSIITPTEGDAYLFLILPVKVRQG